VARLRPLPPLGIEEIIRMPLGLDIWERHTEELVVAASEGQLQELQRRRLAEVERLCTVREFVNRHRIPDPRGELGKEERWT
jgi:hypothetical protein